MFGDVPMDPGIMSMTDPRFLARLNTPAPTTPFAVYRARGCMYVDESRCAQVINVPLVGGVTTKFFFGALAGAAVLWWLVSR